MIELTTGVVFLMSSLYGAGQHGYAEANAAGALPDVTPGATQEIDESSLSDRTVIEAYLRKEYADTPLLVEVARCESTFRHYTEDGKIVRGRINKSDIGVMQINTFYHGETAAKLKIDLYTLEGNVAYAKYLYSKYGAQPWSASSPCWSTSELARK
jgi:hypothetical protein